MNTNEISNLLGDQSEYYLEHTCKTIEKSLIHVPSPSVIEDLWVTSDRNPKTLNSLQSIFSH